MTFKNLFISNKLKERNKLIRIEGKSEVRWLTIKEYQNDFAASDCDDLRKICQVEQRALFSSSKTLLFITRESFKLTISECQFQPCIYSAAQHPIKKWQLLAHPNQQPHHTSQIPKITNTCMGCGETGHWKKWCPKANQSNKNGN